jgi:dipeptidyl aminopeptidase/acylaminoacyl peptidase
VTNDDLRQQLRDAPIPDEQGARERGWRVVRAGFQGHRPPTRAARVPARLGIAIAVAALALALVLTPAGAKVMDVVRDVVQPGEENARPALTSLPSPGNLLVTSPKGAWIVHEEGSKRLLGAYDDATWSPSGLYVAVTRGRELTAVKPDGTVRWSLPAGRPISDPAWAPSGYEIAYRAGDSVRVVEGDGDHDHLLAKRAAPAPPVWAPETERNVLAFVGQDGAVRAVRVDVKSEQTLWRSAPFGGGVKALAWSSTGHLLVLTRSFFTILDRRGQPTAKGPTGGSAESAGFSPDGKSIALARRIRTRSELVTLGTGPNKPESRLYAGAGRFTDVAWSPDGDWVVLGWRDADQWLFIRPDDRRRIAMADIAQQFAPGSSATPIGFPRIAGWCCAP